MPSGRRSRPPRTAKWSWPVGHPGPPPTASVTRKSYGWVTDRAERVHNSAAAQAATSDASRPRSVVDVEPSISTSTSSPGMRGPGEVHRRVAARAPAEQRASVRLGPSTSTSSTRPMRSAFRSAAMRCTTSTSRSSRSCFTSSGTWSGSAAASVPERGEKMNVNALSNRTSSTTASGLLEVLVRLAREADDEVGAEREVGNRVAQPRRRAGGTASRSYVRRMRLRTRDEPDCSGQVDVLADARALGHRSDDGLAEVLRVRAREADALDARRRRRTRGAARRTRSGARARGRAPTS